ncbi:DUF1565 domain-containing protein [Streptomyces rhizosphaericus]|uniref:DUF1565 domain-containing protein n=1 Tax=Streptomyces rhizosphaericus TaxID=114699 RepID=UPI00362FFD9F
MKLRRKRGRHRRRKDRTLPLGSAVIVASAVAGVYLTASPEGASAVPTTLYVATNGSDGNTGTLKSPYRSLEKAFSVAKAGTTIEVRGGTYYPSRTLRSSTSGTPASASNCGRTGRRRSGSTAPGWARAPPSSPSPPTTGRSRGSNCATPRAAAWSAPPARATSSRT